MAGAAAGDESNSGLLGGGAVTVVVIAEGDDLMGLVKGKGWVCVSGCSEGGGDESVYVVGEMFDCSRER